MGRALGINAIMTAGFEATYGVAPSSAAFRRLPFISASLGVEQPLSEDDQIGTGREPLDPDYDVITNDGDVVVPVDADSFGKWLKLMFGAPSTTGSGPYTHVFNSGATSLPSMTIEIGSPEVPAYQQNLGVCGNQLRISMSRRGKLQATIGCIAQGETTPPPSSSVAGSATLLKGSRFRQAIGQVSRDGSALGSIVSADFTFTNNLEKVETIRADGMIDGVDPLKAGFTASIGVRFDSLTLATLAANGTPADLTFGWNIGASANLTFHTARIFLPRTKKPVQGPNGLLATYNVVGSGEGGHVCVATLVNALPGTTY
jgi:hypothetical protein